MPKSPSRVQYATDDLPGGDRIVRSVGLEEIGQKEIGARVSARRDHDWDHQVMGILDFVARYVLRTGARILPNETLRYGWTLLRFLERTPALLESHEIEDVYSHDPQPAMVPGVDRAIRLGQAADDVMRRNHLSGTGDFPYRGTLCLSCVHLAQMPPRQFFMERAEPNNSDDSGWLIDCGVKREEHEANDLSVGHLAHVAADRPFLVPYLTMPIGCAVAFDKDGAIVFPLQGADGHRDPADPYEFGPRNILG